MNESQNCSVHDLYNDQQRILRLANISGKLNLFSVYVFLQILLALNLFIRIFENFHCVKSLFVK